MKICIVGDAGSVHIKRWVDSLVLKGHTIDVISEEYNALDNAKVHVLFKSGVPKGKLIRAIKGGIRTRKIIKSIKPDIVHAHYLTTYGFYVSASGFHPLVVSPWGSDLLIDPKKSKFLKAIVQFVLKRADAVSAMGKPFNQALTELGCDKKKLFTLRISSVDTSKFHPLTRSITNKDFSVLSARWFKLNYNVDVFIKAIPHVLKRIKNVKFTVIGSGVLEDELKNLSKELGVSDNVLFVGEVDHKDMPKYLANSDLFVDTFVSKSGSDKTLLDKTSGIGNTTLEAMACGTPVLLSNKYKMKGCPYVTYKALDSHDLANKIIELLQNQKMRKQITVESREFVMRNADEASNMQKWEDFYAMIINKNDQ